MYHRMMVRRILLLFAFVAAFSTPAAAEKLTVYTWQGYGTGSNILNPKFAPKWKAVLTGKSDTAVVEKSPTPERMLEQFSKAHIIYGNTHSGVPKKAAEQGLQVGQKGSARYVLTAQEIA